MEKMVKGWPLERVDLRDWEDAVGYLPMLDQMRQHRTAWLPEGRSTIGSTTTFSARIFDGFDVDTIDPVACTFRINQGSGIFQYVYEGELVMGLMAGDEGEAYQTASISASPNGTYDVWVRFVLANSDTENRVFWNATGATEEVDFVASRQSMTWQYQILLAGAPAPAGGDWVKVWTLVKAAGAISLPTSDVRHFFFEGYAGTGADQWRHEWGDGATDRNAARGACGIKDLHKFAAYVRRKFADIQGGAHYLLSDPSLGDMAVQHKTNGAHGDVTAESMVVQPPAAPVGTYAGRRVDGLATLNGVEMHRFEEWGRIAKTHHFSDDFNYPTGWSLATTLLPFYTGVATAGGVIAPYVTKEGGYVRLYTAVAGAPVADTCLLSTAANWRWRDTTPTNVSRVYAYFHGWTGSAWAPSEVFKWGFDASGTFRVWWEFDQAVGLWTLKANDGGGGTGSAASTFGPADIGDLHLWIECDPFANAGVGKITGCIYISTGMLQQTVSINPMPGAGITFKQNHSMSLFNSSTSGSPADAYVDFWEAWDEILHNA